MTASSTKKPDVSDVKLPSLPPADAHLDITNVRQEVWTKEKVMSFARAYAEFWKNDAIEKAAEISERYDADPWIARDIRSMKTVSRTPKATETSPTAILNQLNERIRTAVETTTYDTKIVAGFPGVGKSECVRRDNSCLDSDSSMYSWKYDEHGNAEVDDTGKRIRNPEFPGNYIAYIKSQLGKVPAIFVSTHAVVRDALVEADIPFNLVYPDKLSRDDYIDRYIRRGSPQTFVNMIGENWDGFLSELDSQDSCHRMVLSRGQHLADVLDQTMGFRELMRTTNKDQFQSSPVLGR